MICRSEYPTGENRAPLLRLQSRLQALSHHWENLRINQIFSSRHRKMRRKVRIYRHQIRALRKALHGMINAWKKDPSSVTLQDWDKAVEGKVKKVAAIYSKRRLRSKGPENVPYLNFIALYEWDRKLSKERKKTRDVQRRQAKKKAEALKRKAEAEKEAQAKAKAEEAKAEETVVPWRDSVAMAKLKQEREHLNSQLERQMALLRRSRIDPSFVEHDTWMKVIEGTDALTTDSEIVGYVEMARRRKMGEKCDGWVRGRHFGPVERRRRER